MFQTISYKGFFIHLSLLDSKETFAVQHPTTNEVTVVKSTKAAKQFITKTIRKELENGQANSSSL